ncbi:MAG: hypothetical protein GY768_10690 [Planctomycetaceae bacterium]|nr:hypothetical protein [Planctomycetaceae bacterium]
MMKILRDRRQSFLSTAVAVVFFVGASCGAAWADGDIFEPFEPGYPPLTGVPGGYNSFINGDDIPILPAGSLASVGPIDIPPTDITVDLPGLSTSILFDVDGDSERTDERCDTDAEGTLQLNRAAAAAGDTLGNTLCNAAPDTGGVDGICWVAFGILQQVLVISETIASQCDYQDALIDGAEIQAGYQNTVKLIGISTKIYEKQLEDNLLACDPVIGLILPEDSGGQAEWVSDFVGKRIDQYEVVFGTTTHVTKARNRLASGDNKFDAGNYGLAYEKYCAAYFELTKDLQL